jgi:single-strand DNA-binding protein
MANDLNRVMLIGRLTRDPELRQTNTGTSYCRFSIANNRSYTTGGDRKEETSYFNCVAWGRQAELINQYAKKGKQLAVDGRLQQRSWQNQEGKSQSAVDVIAERVQFLASAGGGGSSEGGYSQGRATQAVAPVPNSESAFGSEPPFFDDADPGSFGDDDIPF